jgi:hypothetical protein
MVFHILPFFLKGATTAKVAGVHHASSGGGNHKGAHKAAKALENGARVAREANQGKKRKKNKW